ncbi:probable disease resistance protein At4g27220 [Magnolia sinica]|uniref:probable disease resistance protein At4g27220 n=1 Tax=Magnolia sinica TaxID=86752 RepID=UPI00265B6177|nr:probable disease resistance protein At4g27220 [Magnolia sinica]
MEMDNLKECWIEKCHQLELLFVGRMADIDAAVCLENLRVSNLAKLITVCRGKLGRGSFACLKHIYLECCPKLINFFSSSIRLQNLKLLEIKFCCRLEKVFEEDSEVGQNAFPRLVDIYLWELRKLKSICSGHLPMLKRLKIRGCPLLEKLLLDNTNASATQVEIQESDRAEEGAASRDGDDRRLRQGGEVGVGKSRIMRQVVAAVMDESKESSRLFDVIIRVRAPGVESLAEKMQARIRGELDRLTKKDQRLSTWELYSHIRVLKALDEKGRRNRLMEVQMGMKKALDIPKSIDFYAAAKQISAKLSGQRFLLVLEDVWESINLEEMGVPAMAPAFTIDGKVVITTQSQEVCNIMKAQVNIRVGEWSKEDAWDFLQEEAADVSASIGFSITRDMVFKCFSYISLLCRNGGSIDGDSLIEEYWRSEGFLDGFFNEEENKEAAFKRLGNLLLKELAERCMVLLSLVSSNPNWLHSYLQRWDEYYWADSSKAQSMEGEFKDWLQEQFTMEGSSGGQYHVDMNSQVETLPFRSPNCPLLSTLLLNNNDRLQEIPDAFFQNMTKLRVLDISFTSITSLPSSMSCLCELRLLKLQSCCKLEALPSFLKDMQKLEILDLHQTPLTKMVKVSFHNMQSLRRLNISGACNLSRLSIKGCRSLVKLVSPNKHSKLEALHLSGTKMEVLPHEIFNLTSLRCLDLLGMEHLKTVDWRKINRLPENLNWDRCGLNLLHEQLQDSSSRHISVGDASVFESLDESSKLWKSCFQKFHFLSSSYERQLEVCGGKNSLDGVRGVLSVIEFFHLYGNAFIKALSNLGMEMDNLKECWIEKCHQLEILFVGRMADIDAAVCLENLRVSDLAKLRTVCRRQLGRGSFACLKNIYLECCPKLVNFFSSSIQLQNLKLLEIKFCCRLEKVFEEDRLAGQNAFPQLVDLCLWELRKLKSICGGHLPMLKKLKIRGCPLLEKLPLHNTNASAAEVKIEGELKWWESIKWEGSVKPHNIRFKEWCPSTK